MVICRLGLNGSSPIFSEQVRLCSSTSNISSTISSIMSTCHTPSTTLSSKPITIKHLVRGQDNMSTILVQDNIINIIFLQDNKVVKTSWTSCSRTTSKTWSISRTTKLSKHHELLAPGQHLKHDRYPGQPGSVRRHVAARAHLLLPAGQSHQRPPPPK